MGGWKRARGWQWPRLAWEPRIRLSQTNQAESKLTYRLSTKRRDQPRRLYSRFSVKRDGRFRGYLPTIELNFPTALYPLL